MVSTRPLSDLRSFLNLLKITGNLVHFGEELSTRYEIPAAMDKKILKLMEAIG